MICMAAAASAMVVMAEEYGADVRLVAFMQYTRVVVVTVVAALVARAAGAHAPASSPAFDAMAWVTMGSPAGLALTAALVLGGGWVARRFAVPGGSMVIPLVACVLVQLGFGLTPALPPVLMALAYVRKISFVCNKSASCRGDRISMTGMVISIKIFVESWLAYC